MDASSRATGSLWEVLSSVPDHRRAAGKRYPLAALLLIAVAALLAGRRDQLGIVRWERQLSPQALASLRITPGRARARGHRRQAVARQRHGRCRGDLLAAFSEALGGVIGQLHVPPRDDEITAALDLLKTVPLSSAVVTGDAIFTQKEICHVITEGGGAACRPTTGLSLRSRR